MHRLLIINAHPDYSHRHHHSTAMEDYLVNRVKALAPEMAITTLNLYEEEIPEISQETFVIYRKQAANQLLTPEEQAIYSRSRFLLDQFKAHHRVIISSPLHNFNVTSRLKAYMDNVMVAREVYRYTESGSQGLLKDDYRGIYLQSSGSIFSSDDRYRPLDFAYQYLREMFVTIMGYAAFDVVRYEGSDLLGADQTAIFQQAKVDIDRLLETFLTEE